MESQFNSRGLHLISVFGLFTHRDNSIGSFDAMVCRIWTVASVAKKPRRTAITGSNIRAAHELHCLCPTG